MEPNWSFVDDQVMAEIDNKLGRFEIPYSLRLIRKVRKYKIQKAHNQIISLLLIYLSD